MDRGRHQNGRDRRASAGVMRRLTAALALDAQAQADVSLYVDVVDQQGYAGETARADFRHELYRVCCVGFLKIQHNLVVTFAAKLTEEALIQLEAIEVAAGAREAPAPIAPPPPPKSGQELLTEGLSSNPGGQTKNEQQSLQG